MSKYLYSRAQLQVTTVMALHILLGRGPGTVFFHLMSMN